MANQSKNTDTNRREMLEGMLIRLRDMTYERVKRLRRDQEQEAEPPPADEMDVARATSDVETHAGLIALEEDKLRFVDEAIARLETGRYGACLGCHEPIPLERLQAIPFAAYCVDCQTTRNHARRNWSEGGTIQPYDQQWTVPEEMEEPTERAYRTTGPEEEVPVRFEQPFGPEERRGPKPTTKRKRAPARKKPST